MSYGLTQFYLPPDRGDARRGQVKTAVRHSHEQFSVSPIGAVAKVNANALTKCEAADAH